MKLYEAMNDKSVDLHVFKFGDFYELFDDEARKFARMFELTLVSRDWHGKRMPMCGFPYHQIHKYLQAVGDNNLTAKVYHLGNGEFTDETSSYLQGDAK